MTPPLVSFIGIGAQKAASGWIFRTLQGCPEITTPLRVTGKEVDFFNHNWFLGFEWYEALFASRGGIAGEYSVSYAADRNVPHRIYRYNPEARLIFSVRDPIERALSQHRYLVGRGLVPPELHDFIAAWHRNPSYFELGLYGAVVKRYLSRFPSTALHIIDYDDIAAQPQSVAQQLFAFVGCPHGGQHQFYAARPNEALVARNRASSAARQAAAHTTGLLPPALAHRLRRSRVARSFRGATTRPVDAWLVARPPEDRLHELRAIYTHDVHALGAAIGRDYTHWLEVQCD